MLILDKQKAVERIVALTQSRPVVEAEDPPAATRPRAYQRVAVFERRTPVARRVRRRERLLPSAGGAASL
jgi:hypothetical protein